MTGMAVEVRAGVATRGVDLDFQIAEGRTLALVGPNGAGKSTALGLVSGLVRPESGQVLLAGRVVADASRLVPPHQRDGVLMTQRPLLFDHLSVLDNAAFGPRARGASTADARRRGMAELEAVGLAALASRRPRELSGGQAQRVALARALAADPAVLMLDEPLAALDVEAAQDMRVLLAERLRERTVLVVTHDALDLWTLADDLVVLEAGRVVASGAVEEAAAHPPSGFVAGLVGVNRLLGVGCEDGVVRLGSGDEVVGVPSGVASLPMPGEPAMCLFEPAAVTLHRADDPVTGSARNRWRVRVEAVEPRGPVVRVRLVTAASQSGSSQHLAADVTPRSAVDLGVRCGQELVASVKAVQVRVARDVRG